MLVEAHHEYVEFSRYEESEDTVGVSPIETKRDYPELLLYGEDTYRSAELLSIWHYLTSRECSDGDIGSVCVNRRIDGISVAQKRSNPDISAEWVTKLLTGTGYSYAERLCDNFSGNKYSLCVMDYYVNRAEEQSSLDSFSTLRNNFYLKVDACNRGGEFSDRSVCLS